MVAEKYSQNYKFLPQTVFGGLGYQSRKIILCIRRIDVFNAELFTKPITNNLLETFISYRL